MKEYIIEMGMEGNTFSKTVDGETLTEVVEWIEEAYDVPSLDYLKIIEVKNEKF